MIRERHEQKREGLIPGNTEDRAFSSVDLVGQCLMDVEKAAVFRRAIEATVRPEHTVIDIGTGSGLLALMMSRAGAREVYALEFDPFIAELAQSNFNENREGRRIKLLQGDARSFPYPEGKRFDVVCMEMLSTGLVDEMQVQAINNLHEHGAVHQNTVFLPARQDTYFSLVDVDWQLFGFDFRMHRHEWRTFPEIRRRTMSEEVLLNSVPFDAPAPERHSMTYDVAALEDGTISGLRLRSRAFLHDEEACLESTISVNAPVLVPIPAISVKKGNTVRVLVRYKFGHGYPNLDARADVIEG